MGEDSRFEVFRISNSQLRTINFTSRLSRMSRFHAPPSVLLRWAMMSLASAMGSVVKGAWC